MVIKERPAPPTLHQSKDRDEIHSELHLCYDGYDGKEIWTQCLACRWGKVLGICFWNLFQT